MKVAVCLAANPGNLGMYSVDMAAEQFFQRHGIDHTLFCAQSPNGDGAVHRIGNLEIQHLSGPDALAPYTHIVFWGDFQNNPQYGASDFAQRDVAFGHSANRTAALARWRSIFLDNHALAQGRPVLSIGNNFTSMGGMDPAARTAILGEAPYDAFTAILPRDPMSTEALKTYVPTLADKVSQGLDCAFLLDVRGVVKHIAPTECRTHFCHFFHRSKLKNVDELLGAIAERTGLQPRKVQRWLHAAPHRAHRRYKRLMREILQGQFFISDTYHACINGMNGGVPTFTLARSETTQHGTLSDYKKRVLFDMVGLEKHCFSTQSDTLSPSEIEQVVEAVAASNPDAPQAGAARRAELVAQFEASVLSALGHEPARQVVA